jgi:hypothetical protein
MPLGKTAFLSEAEFSGSNCNRSDCLAWGLSVWLTEEDVKHALSVFAFMRKWHIFRGEIKKSDGTMLHTESAGQPNHHTFWKKSSVDLTSRFTLAMAPKK